MRIRPTASRTWVALGKAHLHLLRPLVLLTTHWLLRNSSGIVSLSELPSASCNTAALRSGEIEVVCQRNVLFYTLSGNILHIQRFPKREVLQGILGQQIGKVETNTKNK